MREHVLTDERAQRDKFERLQVEAKRVRTLLDDAKHFERMHLEVSAEALKLRDELDPAKRTLERARLEGDEVRVRSLRVKRQRAEKEVALQFFTAARLSFGILAVVGAAIAGVQLGRFQHLGIVGWLIALLGAGTFLTVAFRLGARLSGRRDQEM